MAPSVSLDGKKVLFAGVKNRDDHFHIYEVNIDGTGLRQITGVPGDTGCSGTPFLLIGKQGQKLSLSERRRIDYDDIDPAYLPDGRIIFSSTRTPLVSLYDGRRVCNLWVMNRNGSGKHQITYGLAGERWPYVLKDGRITYSYWSRTLTRSSSNELLSASGEKSLDVLAREKGIQIVTGELPNSWWPAAVNPDGTDFRALTKPAHSAIHARPLFNGNLVYATQEDPTMTSLSQQRWLEQIPPGAIEQASGGRIGLRSDFPQSVTSALRGSGELQNQASMPSALPNNQIVFSAAKGLFVSSDNWKDQKAQNSRLLFHEPGRFESEPQAVYARKCLPRKDQSHKQIATLRLAGGKTYTGPVGGVSSPDIYTNPVPKAPGQTTDINEGPLFIPPPKGLIKSIEFYAVQLNKGSTGLPSGDVKLSLIGNAPITDRGGFHIRVPAGVPLMQVAKDRNGRLATWEAAAVDSKGRKAKLAGFAGDHFGYAVEGVEHNFCVGCHAGHTVMPGSGIADVICDILY
jgi:hypothetical protein